MKTELLTDSVVLTEILVLGKYRGEFESLWAFESTGDYYDLSTGLTSANF